MPEPVVLESPVGVELLCAPRLRSTYSLCSTSGYVAEEGAIQLRIDSLSAEDTAYKGESSHVGTVTHAQGFYVPGPGAGVGLSVLLGVAAPLDTWLRSIER